MYKPEAAQAAWASFENNSPRVSSKGKKKKKKKSRKSNLIE